MLHDRVRQLCDEGKWDEANHAASAAVDKARDTLDDGAKGVEELATSLEVKGDYLRRHGDLGQAQQAYMEAIELLEGNAEYTEPLARISASIAIVYESDGNTDEAINYYRRSIELFERMDPPAVLDIANLCNNLAYIYKSFGDFDTAESLYLKALEICHDYLGPNDEETAAICNNVGALYLAAECYEQAREMHMMALEARRKTFGEQHLETAQSYANLAVALSYTDEADMAKKNFQSSLKIFESQVKVSPMDYATVSANYAEFLRAVGEDRAAASVEKRAGKKLKRVS